MLITYLIIRLFTLPFAYLPYKTIHFLGRHLGSLAYYAIPKYRKRALSNIALSDLNLTNDQIRQTAKGCLQSLMITALEYPKLIREKNIDKVATLLNPEKPEEILKSGKGAIFFCGHQANWEILFLAGTSRIPGVAIGRPIKNRYLYNWVQSMRERFGGKIIMPKNAIKEGLRALKNGSFFGIVGDQGMPGSGFSSTFLGRKAWTSPLPALLAYRTNTPIFVATAKREKGRYTIQFSEPIYPNLETPMEEEIRRLMLETLSLFEQSVRKTPEQWMWIHNRWKQQTTKSIKRSFRHDSLALFLPYDESLAEELPILRTLYPTEHISLYVPKSLIDKITLDAEIHPYTTLDEVCQDDLRYKLILNFTKNPKINRHYKRKAAQNIVHLSSIQELTNLAKNSLTN